MICKKNICLLLVAVLIIPLFTTSRTYALTGSDFQAGRIIDDHIFYDSNSFGTYDIQAFLNSKVPACDSAGTTTLFDTTQGDTVTRAVYSSRRGIATPFVCLKDYTQTINAKEPDQYCIGSVTGGLKTAAQIIKDVSVACGVSPKTLLILLQKEQSLVTDDWPWPTQYDKATGFACPDTAACDPQFVGFFNQVYSAARQFQRYAKQPEVFGYRANRSTYIQYNPNAGCGGSSITIQNSATAGLYNYTPYQPNVAALNNLYGTGDSCSAYGNRNFWRMYSDWFGPTLGWYCAFQPTGIAKTDVVFSKQESKTDYANFVIYDGTSTNCIETHGWNKSPNSWKNHTASNHPTITPGTAYVDYADLDSDGKDEAILVALSGTGSGMIEFHVWNSDMHSWQNHLASNMPIVEATKGRVVFGDVDGDGKDEAILVGYNGTGSGMIEFHVWNQGMGTWKDHYASNMPVVDMTKGRVVFGDVDGDGKDEAILVGYNGTGSGMIEFHVWNQGMGTWKDHYASNMPVVDTTNSRIYFADTDGNNTDEAVLVGLRGTGSGMIEFHVWNQGMGTWKDHYASNQPSVAQ